MSLYLCASISHFDTEKLKHAPGETPGTAGDDARAPQQMPNM
jgi:hypothetical protein